MATTPNDPPNDTLAQPGSTRGAAKHLAEDVWYAGLGLAAVVGEQTGRLVGALVRKGRQVEPSVLDRGRKARHGVSEAVDDVSVRLKDLAAKVGRGAEVADEKMATAIENLGFPTRQQVDELRAKVESLSAKLDAMRRE